MARETDRYSRREILRAIGAATVLGGIARGDEPESPSPSRSSTR